MKQSHRGTVFQTVGSAGGGDEGDPEDKQHGYHQVETSGGVTRPCSPVTDSLTLQISIYVGDEGTKAPEEGRRHREAFPETQLSEMST